MIYPGGTSNTQVQSELSGYVPGESGKLIDPIRSLWIPPHSETKEISKKY